MIYPLKMAGNLIPFTNVDLKSAPLSSWILISLFSHCLLSVSTCMKGLLFVMDDLINYVWHLKHAPEQNIIGFSATLMPGCCFFCPPWPFCSTNSTKDPVEGNVSAPHCCCNTTHLCVNGVNWSGVFVLLLSPHSFILKLSPPLFFPSALPFIEKSFVSVIKSSEIRVS